MSKHHQDLSHSPQVDETKKEETWWQKPVVKDSAAVLIGIGIGIVVCYTWLLQQDWFIHPVIDNAVRATIAAQPTLTPIPTYAPYVPAASTKEPTQSPITCASYGITITSHTNGAIVGERFPVSGSYRVKPPQDSLLLINKSPDSAEYWPSASPVQINETLQTWSGEFYIFGAPPKKADIIVAVVGKSGRALYEYYVKVGNKTNSWESINILTDDVIECDRITVEKRY